MWHTNTDRQFLFLSCFLHLWLSNWILLDCLIWLLLDCLYCWAMHGWRSGCCIDILFLHSSQNLLCCIDLLRKKAIIITCIFVYMALDYTKKNFSFGVFVKIYFWLIWWKKHLARQFLSGNASNFICAHFMIEMGHKLLKKL
jgi:hypothetical protein